jgi:uncharacterized membrane protein
LLALMECHGSWFERISPPRARRRRVMVGEYVRTPTATILRKSSSRVASIDAARGSAMLFVCLAHFTNSFFFQNGQEGIGDKLVAIGMLASPTFVIVSGLVAGFLAVTRRSSFPHFRRKLIDRGLFLLVAGHLVLAVSGFGSGKGFVSAYRLEYITDAIGFAILLGPWLVAALAGRSRLLLAAAIFVFDWCAILLWAPSNGIPSLAKQYLVGAVDGGRWLDTAGGFALIPWFAVYIVGTVIGGRVGAYYASKRPGAARLFLARTGIVSVTCALAARIGSHFLTRTAPLFAQTHATLLHLLSLYQKFPPGPVYLCFFGGAGMLLVAAVLEAGHIGMAPWLMNELRQLGQASFFVYVIQFYVYGVVLHALRLPYTPFWPLIFLFTIALLALVATAWNWKEGNRFLTIGIGALLDRADRRRRETRDRPTAVVAGEGEGTARLAAGGRPLLRW